MLFRIYTVELWLLKYSLVFAFVLIKQIYSEIRHIVDNFSICAYFVLIKEIYDQIMHFFVLIPLEEAVSIQRAVVRKHLLF